MLNSLSSTLYRISSWKTLAAAVILYIPFPVFFFKILESRMNLLADQAIGPIDLLVGFKPDRIQAMVARYGPVGRDVYALGELTIDIAYPVIYTVLLSTILSLLFQKRMDRKFSLVNILPVLVFAFDLMENACIVALLKMYPQTSVTLASLCSILTNCKWAMCVVVLGFILFGLALLALGNRTRQIA